MLSLGWTHNKEGHCCFSDFADLLVPVYICQRKDVLAWKCLTADPPGAPPMSMRSSTSCFDRVAAGSMSLTTSLTNSDTRAAMLADSSFLRFHALCSWDVQRLKYGEYAYAAVFGTHWSDLHYSSVQLILSLKLHMLARRQHLNDTSCYTVFVAWSLEHSGTLVFLIIVCMC